MPLDLKSCPPYTRFTMKEKFYIGVDGGGSGTRVIVADQNLNILTTAKGPPSALGQGIDRAWKSILETIASAFTNIQANVPMLSEIAIGLGVSGVNNILWKNEFMLRNPGFKNIIVDTDGFTTLLGAHKHKPGVIVAIGTGSVGVVLKNDGSRQSVSGWGYPAGDEASGAWLGLHASSITQKCLDGRRPLSPLATEVINFCKKENKDFLTWLGSANQNTFAKLAPLVFKVKDQDPQALELLHNAGMEITEMVLALDPNLELPLSICGRLGEELIYFLPEDIKNHHRSAEADSSHGALLMIYEKMKVS